MTQDHPSVEPYWGPTWPQPTHKFGRLAQILFLAWGGYRSMLSDEKDVIEERIDFLDELGDNDLLTVDEVADSLGIVLKQ